jgi:hypothetical protein
MIKKKTHRGNKFYEQQPTIKFTIEREVHNSINFLNHSIQCRDKGLEFAIYYRISTQTDIIISNDSCHPHEHKISGIKYLANRLNTYPVSKEVEETELNIIKNTLPNNNYNIKKMKKHAAPQKHNTGIHPQH